MAAGPAPAHTPGVREEPRRGMADRGGTQHREPLRGRVRHLAGRRYVTTISRKYLEAASKEADFVLTFFLRFPWS